jgi:putative membrane protein
MRLIISLLLNSLALFLTDKLVPGFEIKDFVTAVLLAIILGFLNTFIKPLLVFLTAPLTLLTLGLFIFIVNAVILGIAAYIVPGVNINGPLQAIIAAIVLSFISTALSLLARDLGKKK